jgi:DNA-binding MurR/RpiR family transcriptional regulator
MKSITRASTEIPNPTSFEELKAIIAAEHNRLSRRLRQIGEFLLAEPDQIALETISTLAGRIGVQPSAMIRFAKHFGFSGFSQMQQLFRGRLIDRVSTYRSRIQHSERADRSDGPRDILSRFCQLDQAAIRKLQDETDARQLRAAVKMLSAARIVGLVGTRRAFPVATYLAYGLSHLGRRVRLLDGLAGMLREEALLLEPKDALIAVSFKPYAAETLEAVRACRERGVAVLAITDSAVSPLAPISDAVLEVADAQFEGIRSLTASMCLAVSLVVALGHAQKGRSAPLERDATGR